MAKFSNPRDHPRCFGSYRSSNVSLFCRSRYAIVSYLLAYVIRKKRLLDLRRDDLRVQVLRQRSHFVHTGRYVWMKTPHGRALLLRQGRMRYPMGAGVRFLDVIWRLEADGVLRRYAWRRQQHGGSVRLRDHLVLRGDHL